MEVIFSLFCGMLILSGSQGLEMTLDRASPVTPGSRIAFCYLICEENLESVTSSVVNIISMNVFKKLPHAASDEDSSEKGNPLVSLTLEEPKLSRTFETIKVDGILEGKRSAIHVDMFREADCLAAYTCEVQTQDFSGNVLTNTNRLRQQQFNVGGQDMSGTLASSVSIQLLTLVLQLDNKLALLGQSSNNMQDRTDSLERRLEQRIWSVESRISAFESRLEHKIESLGNSMGSLKDQIESKIENRVVDKLYQLDVKMSKRGSKVLKGDFEGIKGDSFTDAPVESGSVGDQINSMSKVLSTLKKDIHQLQSLEKENQHDLKNATAEMKKISGSFDNLAQNIANNTFLLGNERDPYCKDFELHLQNWSVESISTIHDLLYSTRTSITGNIKSTMTDLLSPKSCRKGMLPALSRPSFPYPIVSPSEESGLDVPYMCDSFTDGGGWIIIQRRSTGNVNFYRDWATYKDGFGSMDGDFWLGNEKIHALTSNGVYELRIELRYKGKSAWASYNSFALGDEQSKYTLKLGKYNGTAGDSLRAHNREPFSTFDKDHDLYDRNCAEVFTGAWWYKACHNSNLNGEWEASAYKGPNWQTLSRGEPVSFSEMKIRRIDES